MAYIGNIPAEKYSALTQQTFSSPTGTSFTLSTSVTNSRDIALFVDNVRQDPTSYTAVGTALTTSTISSPSTMYCLFIGKTVETVSPSAGSVDSSHLVAGSVDDSHISGVAASKLTGALPAISGASLTGLPTEITKAASDPTISTNPAGGVGTVFLNTTSGEMFSLTDATAGANIWTNIGDGTGAVPIIYMSGTGGTITTDGSYKVHTFLSSGTFTPTVGNVVTVGDTVEYLVIAGAGGGGSNYAGGGGAGGYRTATGFTVTNTGLTVTVGGGGAGSAGAGAGTVGNDSDFSSINSDAGGYGGGPSGAAGGPGGSGGGGSNGGAGGTATASPSQGNNGATGASTAGGGGGGAGSASPDKHGGNGLSSSINGSAVTRGGGGGGYTAGSPGTGGTGGGGNAGTAGTVNTGSGGGADIASGGKAGGSGVVIIRYQFQA